MRQDERGAGVVRGRSNFPCQFPCRPRRPHPKSLITNHLSTASPARMRFCPSQQGENDLAGFPLPCARMPGAKRRTT
jgi:hypothetical protein